MKKFLKVEVFITFTEITGN